MSFSVVSDIDLTGRYRAFCVRTPSLYATIAGIYARVSEPHQRRACLNYLLQYQHYNADYTVRECLSFGYPAPLYAPQDLPGYVRTEYNRLLDLTDVWMEERVIPFMRSAFIVKDPRRFFKLSSDSALGALRTFYSNEIDFIDPQAAVHTTQKKKVMVIQIEPDDLRQGAGSDEILRRLFNLDREEQLQQFAQQYKDLKFLFVLKAPANQCILMWGAVWDNPKKSTGLRCQELSSQNFFGKRLFSFLNQSGAVPDRIDLNRMVTQELGQGDFAADLKMIGEAVPALGIDPQVDNYPELWADVLEKCTSYNFDDDHGSQLYFDAICRWQTQFFEKFPVLEIAAPVLCSQVAPWMREDSALPQWSKAYQNLCEVVMFCLQSFPEEFEHLELQSTIRESLGKLDRFCDIGLFSYGMAAASHAIQTIIDRQQDKQRTLSLACISRNYFETLLLIDALNGKDLIRSNEYSSLESLSLRDCPDILIADIHPNNAAKDILFPNHIGDWIYETLEYSEKSLTLILDITLNSLSDAVVQTLLKTVSPYIASGRLEIFLIQSLAKFMQLGADNFSGGLGIYIGNPSKGKKPFFPPELPEKRAYFALLSQHFSDITTKYFETIRRNTDRVYRKLSKRLADESFSTIRMQEERVSSQFCAADVTLNTDESTCYVALSFKPLFDALKMKNPTAREKLCDRVRKLILELSEVRELMITGRQSFGFSLCNMSGVCEAIRFSVGIESSEQLEENISLIVDFLEALSRSVVEKGEGFDFDAFENAIKEVFAVIAGQAPFTPKPLSFYDEEEHQKGEAIFHFQKGTFFVDVSIGDSRSEIIPQDQISLCVGHPGLNLEVDRRSLLNLLLRFTFLDSEELSLHYTDQYGYSIFGIIPRVYVDLFSNEDALPTGEKVVFAPDFSLTLSNGQSFSINQVYVDIPMLGRFPSKLSLLNQEFLYKIYQKLVSEEWETIPFQMGSILLKFGRQKVMRNYIEWVKRCLRNGKLPGLVSMLNSQPIDSLPLPHNHTWFAPRSGKESLCKALRSLGYSIAPRIEDKICDLLPKVKNREYRIALVEGMLQCVINEPDKIDYIHAIFLDAVFHEVGFSLGAISPILEEGLRSLWKRLRERENSAEELMPSVKALQTLLKLCFASPADLLYSEASSALKRVCLAVNNMPLNEHLAILEEKMILGSANITKSSAFTIFFSHYLTYPWETSARAWLAIKMKEVPEEVRLEWMLLKPRLYSTEIKDEFEQWQEFGDTDAVVLSPKQKDDVIAFLKSSGCLDLLIKHLSQNEHIEDRYAGLWWAIITEDHDLTTCVRLLYGSGKPLLELL